MKDKILFMFLLLLSSIRIVNAQSPLNIDDYKTLGESRYVITYEMMMTDDTLKPEEKSYDRILLEIGGNISKSYSYNLYRYDSSYTISERNGAHSFLNSSHFNKGVMSKIEIFKYYTDNNMIVVHRMPVQGPIFIYKETMNIINWIPSAETKNILGYQCNKATCQFRGRNWTAWFAPQIPLSDGPWKFCGLPGLILQVEDDKGEYAFTCKGIKNTTKPIVMYDYFYEQSTREEIAKFLINCYEDYYAYMRKIYKDMPSVLVATTDASGKRVPVKLSEAGKKKVPYNPIELE